MYTQSSNTLATWCEELTHWNSPWCWERLKVGGEGDDRGQGGWSITNSTDMSLSKLREMVVDREARRDVILESMALQRVRRHWETEQQNVQTARPCDLASASPFSKRWTYFTTSSQGHPWRNCSKMGLNGFYWPAMWPLRQVTLALSAQLMDLPGISVVKNPPAMYETWVRFLGWEDPLERKKQPTPIFLPGRSHGQRSLAGYSPWGHKRVGPTLRTKQQMAQFPHL